MHCSPLCGRTAARQYVAALFHAFVSLSANLNCRSSTPFRERCPGTWWVRVAPALWQSRENFKRGSGIISACSSVKKERHLGDCRCKPEEPPQKFLGLHDRRDERRSVTIKRRSSSGCTSRKGRGWSSALLSDVGSTWFSTSVRCNKYIHRKFVKIGSTSGLPRVVFVQINFILEKLWSLVAYPVSSLLRSHFWRKKSCCCLALL